MAQASVAAYFTAPPTAHTHHTIYHTHLIIHTPRPCSTALSDRAMSTSVCTGISPTMRQEALRLVSITRYMSHVALCQVGATWRTVLQLPSTALMTLHVQMTSRLATAPTTTLTMLYGWAKLPNLDLLSRLRILVWTSTPTRYATLCFLRMPSNRHGTMTTHRIRSAQPRSLSTY